MTGFALTWLADQTLADFPIVARLAGVALAADDIRIEAMPAPHATVTGPDGRLRFHPRGNVLKVGKVGPKRHA